MDRTFNTRGEKRMAEKRKIKNAIKKEIGHKKINGIKRIKEILKPDGVSRLRKCLSNSKSSFELTKVRIVDSR